MFVVVVPIVERGEDDLFTLVTDGVGSVETECEVDMPRLWRFRSEVRVGRVVFALSEFFAVADKWDRAVVVVEEMNRLESQRTVVILCSPRVLSLFDDDQDRFDVDVLVQVLVVLDSSLSRIRL